MTFHDKLMRKMSSVGDPWEHRGDRPLRRLRPFCTQSLKMKMYLWVHPAAEILDTPMVEIKILPILTKN